MLTFKIEISGFNRFRDRLDLAILHLNAQKLYNSIREKVPEIEMEISGVTFNSVGQNLILNSTNLSSQLQHKLKDAGNLSGAWMVNISPPGTGIGW